ncbi:MAG: hypothetical protein ACYSU0_17485, partial [Planctomycetota bacterium]
MAPGRSGFSDANRGRRSLDTPSPAGRHVRVSPGRCLAAWVLIPAAFGVWSAARPARCATVGQWSEVGRSASGKGLLVPNQRVSLAASPRGYLVVACSHLRMWNGRAWAPPEDYARLSGVRAEGRGA